MAFTPTDPTKAEVRVVGTAPNLSLDFYIPRGAKGEPGGLLSTPIPINTDLDQYLTAGAYSVSAGTDAGASALARLPFHESGTLLVTLSQNGAIQIHTYITNTKNIYVRRRFNGVWGAWRSFTSTRVDTTAGRAIYTYDEANAREQLTYGDTGWRDISSTALGSGIGGSVLVRRAGYQCQLSMRADIPNGTAVGAALATVPGGGFAMNQVRGQYITVRPISSVTPVTYRITSNGIVSLASAWPDNSSGIDINFQWLTNDSWPASLPGTANGSIPIL